MIKLNWLKIGEYSFDKEVGVAAGLLLDGDPKVASSNCLVIAYPYQTAVDMTNNLLIEVEKIIASVANCKYDVIAITTGNWEKVKDEFIQKTKAGEKYFLKEGINYLIDQIDNNDKEKQNNKSIVEILGDLVEMK